MNPSHLVLAALIGVVFAQPSMAQQLDFSSPFGRTVAPRSVFTDDDSPAPLIEKSETDPIGEIVTTSAATKKTRAQFLIVPTLVSGENVDVYALSGGAAFGPNQVLVRYSKIDPETGANLDQFFAQYKRQVTEKFGVFGFLSRTDTLFRDYGVAGSFQHSLSPSFSAAFNIGYQKRDPDVGADESDVLARGGLLCKVTSWLSAALDYEVENKINDADTTSLELTAYDKFFLGADTEDTLWAGFTLVF